MSKLPPIPWKRFEVFPGQDNWMAPKGCKKYFNVLIYYDRGWLRRAYKCLAPHLPDSRINTATAVVVPQRRFNVSAKGKVTPVDDCIGWILLPLSFVNMEVITHESTHAGTTYIRSLRRSLNLGPDIEEREERLAYAIGSIGRQIAAGVYSAGCYEDREKRRIRRNPKPAAHHQRNPEGTSKAA